MTELLRWDPQTLSVHVPEMDRQHEHLISLMNRLYDRREAGAAPGELGNVLALLGDATVKHFAAEEQLMGKVGYPDLRRHQSIHASLLKQFGEHAERFKTTGDLTDEFFTFLRLWLSAHIKGIDKQYSEHAARRR